MKSNSLLDYSIINGNEEELRYRIRQLYDILESSYDGIFLTDGEANTMFVNKAYEKIAGVKREQILGKNMELLEKKGIISKSSTLMVLKTGKSITIEQEFMNGKKVLVSSSPIIGENGKIVMVVTNVRDVTELYELKEQLEKKNELTQKYYSELELMRKQLHENSDIIAEDKKMLAVLESAGKVSKIDTIVILLGETGSGKEEVAKFIHRNSKRAGNAFIKVNCGAIPENLMESELFGYEKGAFTGANKEGKIGMFELADKGTIFLDEIGELPLDMQVKLLRVLQENEIKRVGGTTNIKIDVKVIAATNRNLKDMVDNKQFRADLYYRLNIIPIKIPPLRERTDDIEPLILYFLGIFNEKYGMNKTISQGAMDRLKRYEWPGNVRELRNIIERVSIMCPDDKIMADDLPIAGINGESIETIKFVVERSDLSMKDAVEKLEASMIENAFERHGNVRAAAKELGIDASTFVRKRKRYEENKLLQK
ncbi:MAG TPA: sigma 54-interacting transcriptional regulator [Clostridiaceae bacterium]